MFVFLLRNLNMYKYCISFYFCSCSLCFNRGIHIPGIGRFYFAAVTFVVVYSMGAPFSRSAMAWRSSGTTHEELVYKLKRELSLVIFKSRTPVVKKCII